MASPRLWTCQRQQAREVLLQWSEEADKQPDLTPIQRVDLIEKHSAPLRALLQPRQLEIYEDMLRDLRRQAEPNDQ